MTKKQLGQLLFDYWYIPALVVALGLLFWYLSTTSREKTIERLETNIATQTGVNAVLTNTKIHLDAEVNKTIENSNQAQANFNSSLSTDSNQFHGDSTNKFCIRFPCDSTCGEWRKHRPEIQCR